MVQLCIFDLDGTLANTLDSIGLIIGQAMGLAMITVVGQALGAGSEEQAKYYVKKMMGYAYLFMAILNLGLIAFAGPIAGLYRVTEETRRLAAGIIVFHSVCATVLWPTGFSLPNAMRAAMDATFTMAVSILSMWTFRIGCSYLFVSGLHMGLLGIWAAMGVDWIFRSACFLWRMSGGRWLKNARQAE